MAIYTFTGTTSQFSTGHPNFMLAVKVDPTASPMFTILDQVAAAGDGTFTLQWADWSGRVLIGAVDDEATEPLNCDFRDFKVGTLTGYSETVILDAPIFYYEVDETSGTVAADSSGNGNDGTYSSLIGPGSFPPTLAQTSLINDGTYSIYFDGSTNYPLIDTGITQDLQIFSVEAWVSSERPGSGLRGIVRSGTATYDWMLYELASGSISFAIRSDVGGLVAATISSSNFGPNETIHVVGTFDGTDIRIYLNGALIDTANHPVTVEYTANPIIVGNSGGFNGSWQGYMDEIAVYNKALSAQEIQDHYDYGVLKQVSTDGLLAYWKFDESTGSTTVADSHGSFDGTATSTAIRTVDGKFGNALIGDGTNYVDLGTASDLLNLSATNEVTLAAWFYIPTGNSVELPILDLGFRSGNGDQFNTGLRFSTNVYRIIQGADDAPELPGTVDRGVWGHGLSNNFVYDEWNLIVMDRNTTTASAYLYNSSGQFSNSISYATNLLDNWESRGNYIFVRTNGSPTENIELVASSGSKLDSTFVYNRVLSKTERDGIWNLGIGKDL